MKEKNSLERRERIDSNEKEEYVQMKGKNSF
jgi:hypothetical protein